MRDAGLRLAHVLQGLVCEVKVGIPTKTLDNECRRLIKEVGGKPAFLGYTPAGSKEPYPAALCVSVNDVVVHGVPGDYRIGDGDLVKIDIGLLYKGFYVDAATTVPVGSISEEARRLLRATEEALRLAVFEAREGNALGDIGATVQRHIESHGLSVIRDLCGHGIGRKLHEDPPVFNFGKRGEGIKLKAGMVLAIEPMVSAGSGEIIQRQDGSFATKDGSLSAHFEHTVAITSKDPIILTSI